jgi:hypothetical protein
MFSNPQSLAVARLPSFLYATNCMHSNIPTQQQSFTPIALTKPHRNYYILLLLGQYYFNPIRSRAWRKPSEIKISDRQNLRAFARVVATEAANMFQKPMHAICLRQILTKSFLPHTGVAGKRPYVVKASVSKGITKGP